MARLVSRKRSELTRQITPPAKAVNRDKFSEPSPRNRHFSALVEGKVYVWAGNTDGTKDVCLYHFDPLTESWSQSDCIGPNPPGCKDAACASAGHHLYVYGGRDKENARYHSSLHQLDLRTKTWRMISSDGPRRKRSCGLVHVAGDLSSYLLLFGGEDEGFNDTDEIHMFDLNEGEKEGAMCYGYHLLYIWGLVHVMKCELKCMIVRP